MEEAEEYSGESDIEAMERNANLEQLQEYVNQMAYKVMSKEIVTCKHTNRISCPKRKVLIDVYNEMGHVMQPKERAERLRQKVMKLQAITTEQLEDAIKCEQRKEGQREAIRRKAEKQRHATLSNLQKHCVEKIMRTLVNKFAKHVADKSANYKPQTVVTENFHQLQKTLVCHLYSELNIQPSWKDYPVYTSVAAVLAELMLQSLFLYQNAKTSKEEEKNSKESEEVDECAKLAQERDDIIEMGQKDKAEFANLMQCYDL